MPATPPSAANLERIRAEFSKRRGIRNVAMAVDGTHGPSGGSIGGRERRRQAAGESGGRERCNDGGSAARPVTQHEELVDRAHQARAGAPCPCDANKLPVRLLQDSNLPAGAGEYPCCQ